MALKTWSVGEVLTAADLNDELGKLYKADVNTQAAFNSAGYTTILLPTIVLSDLGGFTVAGDYWVAPWTGHFEVMLAAAWSGASGVGSMGLEIQRYNSSGVAQEFLAGAFCANPNTYGSCSGIGAFTAGERVYFRGYNNSGGAAGTVFCRASVIARG